MNLYINADQAMPDGGRIYVKTRNCEIDNDMADVLNITPGKYIKISVTDTGVGMDKETMKRIFDPFFTTKSMGRGTGLGLASVYGIIRNHKGAISAKSEIGKGSTFEIYLPAVEAEPEGIEKEAKDEKIKTGTGTILLVDDEDMIIEIGKQFIDILGYRAICVKSGQEAIKILKDNPDIDLVILDIIMPGMSGGVVFDKIKEIRPDVKVLLSSGFSIDGEARSIMERGCNGFIQKPFDLKRFSKKIYEILGKE